MTRGNQRDHDRKRARDKADKLNKTKTTMSGSEFQRAKENAAAIMREKQRKADERKAAEAEGSRKK